LAPGSWQEAHDLTARAFDLAFKYRNPVLILADAIVGQMKEPVTLRPKRELTPEASDWALSGAKGRPKRLLKSLYLDEGELAERNLVLKDKYQRMTADVAAEGYALENAALIVVAFGSIGRIVKSTVRDLRQKGHAVGLFRPLTLFPFPSLQLRDLAQQGKRFLTIEHNLGQMVEDVRLAVCPGQDSGSFTCLPGNLPTPEDFKEPIIKALEESTHA
jgi:2-oxoglutarate ferredoxin oxidoreductase subunit alpha